MQRIDAAARIRLCRSGQRFELRKMLLRKFPPVDALNELAETAHCPANFGPSGSQAHALRLAFARWFFPARRSRCASLRRPSSARGRRQVRRGTNMMLLRVEAIAVPVLASCAAPRIANLLHRSARWITSCGQRRRRFGWVGEWVALGGSPEGPTGSAVFASGLAEVASAWGSFGAI